MANEQTAKTLTMGDMIEINRALGVIEGVAAVEPMGVAETICGALERIDAVINGGEET